MAVEDEIAGWIQPSRNDIRRAKSAVLELLGDGTVHASRELITAAQTRLGLPPLTASPMQIDTRKEKLGRDASAIAAFRGAIAGHIATAQLAAHGAILPALSDASPSGGELPAAARFKIYEQRSPMAGGSKNTEPILTGAPEIAFAYVMTSWSHLEEPWYLDPDLLVPDEIAHLVLGGRASRALREALDAYRQGLYLACASLLGVVSEAVWYEGAARLTEAGGGWTALEKALKDTATARVIELVGQAIREKASDAKLSATTSSELIAEATLLRDLRNYGVHPAKEDQHLERWLEEDTCGLLIARMYRYLRQLVEALDALVAITRADAQHEPER